MVIQTKRGCPNNCCFCVYTVVQGKKILVNPVNEVIKEIKQLYDLGVMGFWYTYEEFIPAKKHIKDEKNFCRLSRIKARTIFIELHTSEKIILMIS